MDTDIKDISLHFADETLEIITKALRLAYRTKRSVCTPVHLFNILVEIPSAQEIFQRVNIDYRTIQEKLKQEARDISYPVRIDYGKVVFSPELKLTLLRAYLLTKELKRDTVSLDILLVATLNSQEIAKVVKELGLVVPLLEEKIEKIAPRALDSDTQGSLLKKFSIDLIERTRSKGSLEIIGREQELAQLIRILVRQGKNNAVLLGEAGVGRSSIIGLLAKRIARREVAQLNDVTLLELNLMGIINALSGRNVGDISEFLSNELQNLNNVIFLIKNFESASEEVSLEKAFGSHLLRSILSIGKARIILTMTTTAYKRFMAKESTIASDFEVVKVDEPSIETTIQILASMAPRLATFHRVTLEPGVIDKAVLLSKRYLQDKYLPAKAIDLLDEACTKAALESRKVVTVDDIQAIISQKTGIPIEKLTESEKSKLLNLENELNTKLIGQKDAVYTVSEVIRRSRAGLKDPKKPIGSFLFLGPSGVGKTYLAKNLARLVYDSENAMIRLDMSEFGEPHTVQRLIGSPPGYVGYGEGGQLTNPVWERPYSLILLDEIEKADPKIFDIFLQILDEGRLTDGQGRTVDFKNTIIIATSNIASEEILKRTQGQDTRLTGFDKERFLSEQILPLLKEYFRPEFINRFDEIVIFNPLGIDELSAIARLQIQQIEERLKDKKIKINISDELLREFAQKSYNPSFGARPLIRLIQDRIENVIARKIISGEIVEGETVNM